MPIVLHEMLKRLNFFIIPRGAFSLLSPDWLSVTVKVCPQQHVHSTLIIANV